jgi:hypothetical protein
MGIDLYFPSSPSLTNKLFFDRRLISHGAAIERPLRDAVVLARVGLLALSRPSIRPSKSVRYISLFYFILLLFFYFLFENMSRFKII